jgi:beta-mannosidase
MFTPLEIDVTDKLVTGANELRVDFESAVKVGVERRREYFDAENIKWSTAWFDERAFVRKAQYMSGWDWGPRFVSCGIWGKVQLLEFASRIQRASFLQEKLSNGKFRVWADVVVEGDAGLTLEVAGQTRKAGEIPEFEIESDLWWPAGEGGQHLLDASATLDSGDRVQKRIGLRTIELLREPDKWGRSFEFLVNDRPVWIRGANWIPDDSFVTRISKAELQRRLSRYPDLGMNMLRVWGGGFYESEDFYDACDETGLMVWQDFPYACSYYPESDQYLAVCQAEAEVQVLRLRDRASLSLWCGNNENTALWEGKWGGSESAPDRYFGDRIYKEALPAALRKWDTSTPYIETSPVGTKSEDASISEDGARFGDHHYWNVWHGEGDWIHYEKSETRFSSEFGFASSCSLAAWEPALAPEDWNPHSAAVRWHDKTGKGHDTFHGYVNLHYPESESLEDWVYYSQLNQRDAMRFGVEHYRRTEYCRGALIWQINDCWPVQSWALEDYQKLLKPAGHELSRLYRHLMLSSVLSGDEAIVWLINDSHVAYEGTVHLEWIDTVTGDLVSAQAFAAKLGSNERKVLGSSSFAGMDRTRTVLRLHLDHDLQTERWQLLAEPKEIQLGVPRIHSEVVGSLLRLTVKGFAHDVVVWDPESAETVKSPFTGLCGWAPRSVANSVLVYPLGGAPGNIHVRSLAGRHDAVLSVEHAQL